MNTNRRVLLVEDDEDNFELVRILLEKADYEVLGATTGQDAIDLARREKPDLILMDLSLPVMDGWAAANELKLDPQTASIPLLALTAHTLPGDRQRAMSSGFNGYISKPINIQRFQDEIDKAFS